MSSPLLLKVTVIIDCCSHGFHFHFDPRHAHPHYIRHERSKAPYSARWRGCVSQGLCKRALFAAGSCLDEKPLRKPFVWPQMPTCTERTRKYAEIDLWNQDKKPASMALVPRCSGRARIRRECRWLARALPTDGKGSSSTASTCGANLFQQLASTRHTDCLSFFGMSWKPRGNQPFRKIYDKPESVYSPPKGARGLEFTSENTFLACLLQTSPHPHPSGRYPFAKHPLYCNVFTFDPVN